MGFELCEWRLAGIEDDGSLVGAADAAESLGVPGAVPAGVPAGLTSLESVGPIENRGVGFGCAATPAAPSTDAAVACDGLSSC